MKKFDIEVIVISPAGLPADLKISKEFCLKKSKI